MKYMVPRLVYASYEDMAECAKSNAYLNILVNCSCLTPFLFELAKRNVNVEFDFSIDYEKYVRLCGGETLFAEYNGNEDAIVRAMDRQLKARKRK